MLHIFDGLLATSISILLTIAFLCFAYLKWKYTYWERRNFPFLQPRMLFGNLENPLSRKIAAGMELKMFYDELKSKGFKHGGIYSFFTPVYIPIDLEYVKNILSKDFQHFIERGRYYNEEDDPLSAHLFNIGGTKWKNLRVKFTPTFTSGKMKMMVPSLLECGETLKSAIDSRSRQNEPIEINDFAKKFTVDIIGLCVFGIKCNSFTNPNAEFVKCGQMLLRPSLSEAAFIALTFSFPKFSRYLGIRRYNKKATDFFMNVIRDTISYRQSNNIRVCDFVQILMDLKNNEVKQGNDASYQKNGTNLTMEEVAAQAIVFFIAGYDTSSLAISFALYELALNLDIQQKARNEINQIMDKHEGKLTYESITEMKYLQQIMDETLRKYPSLPILNRQCVETYKFPDSDLVLEKGTQIIIPLLGFQHDPEYYPDPEKFDPERFSAANKSERKPFSYLPFGDGPRNCLGMRFGVMQTKLCLAMLLKDYRFSLNPKTSVPLEMDLGIMCSAKGGIWLDTTKLE